MRRRIGGAFAAALVLVAAVVNAAPSAAADTTGRIETRNGTHELRIELAETPEQRERGLMFRRSMPADQGMLFDFDEARPVTMWMKNTFIPLDMLFMDDAGVVTNIRRMAVPQSLDLIPSGGPVRYVLELNGGAAERLAIENGDRLRHPAIGRNGG